MTLCLKFLKVIKKFSVSNFRMIYFFQGCNLLKILIFLFPIYSNHNFCSFVLFISFRNWNFEKLSTNFHLLLLSPIRNNVEIVSIKYFSTLKIYAIKSASFFIRLRYCWIGHCHLCMEGHLKLCKQSLLKSEIERTQIPRPC